jgi:hypothetical protein
MVCGIKIRETGIRLITIAFWDVAPCSLVEVYRLFRGACCLCHQGDDGDVTGRAGLIALISEAMRVFETSVNFCQTTCATSQKTAVFILAAVKT